MNIALIQVVEGKKLHRAINFVWGYVRSLTVLFNPKNEGRKKCSFSLAKK